MVTSNNPLHSITIPAPSVGPPFDASYSRHLEPLRILKTTPRLLRSRLRTMHPPHSAEDAMAFTQRNALILARMAEAELLFSFRLRQAASGQHRSTEALHNDGWQLTPMFGEADDAVALFSRLRRWNIRFIRVTPTFAFGEQRLPARPDAIRSIIEAMAHHDINRLNELASQ